MLSTGYHCDSLVPQRFQNSGCELTARPTVPTSTQCPCPIGEHIAVPSQVQRVIAPTLHVHQVTHVLQVLLLLCP